MAAAEVNPVDFKIRGGKYPATNRARQASLAQRLLAFSHRQPLDPKPTGVNSLFGGMPQLLERALGETIAVETVRASGLWKIEVHHNTTGYARNAIFHHGRLDKGVQPITEPCTFNDLAAKVRDLLDGLPR